MSFKCLGPHVTHYCFSPTPKQKTLSIGRLISSAGEAVMSMAWSIDTLRLVSSEELPRTGQIRRVLGSVEIQAAHLSGICRSEVIPVAGVKGAGLL